MSLGLIQSTLQTAGAHVGDILWWTLDDARTPRHRLEAIWADAGLSRSFLPEPPTAEKALRTAVREAQVGQTGYLIRLAKDDPEELIYAVVDERRDGRGNVSYAQEARITLRRRVSQHLETDASQHDLVRRVSAAYDSLLTTHTADDIRRCLVRLLNASAAVTLRDHGGVYWVPAPYQATVRALQAAVGQLGRSRLDIVPVHASPEATSAIGDAARTEILQDLTSLQAEIDGFLTSPPDRPSTLLRRLQTFEELRDKAQLYHSILQVQVGDLETQLTTLTQHVEGLLQAQAS
jgi:hypothetical protein